MTKTLRAHQREAVDAVLRALELPARSTVPERGLRTQAVMATGSGKTLVAVRGAEELQAGRVLVLVPSLDLLTQTEAAWRESGRTGPVIGISSLRGGEAGFPNTTDVSELVAWVQPFDKVTVFATYASLGLGTLERAHAAGLPGWDLIVVDEAHRASGRIGKPWAVVHDNTRIPALRRLYMTATPRLWQTGEDPDQEAPGAPGEPVASMEDDPKGPFGARCYTLTLSEAIDRGICAPYQVVCVDITDTQFQTALLLGADGRSEAVRGPRGYEPSGSASTNSPAYNSGCSNTSSASNPPTTTRDRSRAAPRPTSGRSTSPPPSSSMSAKDIFAYPASTSSTSTAT